MTSHAVIGLGFGDEGKGLFTDYLCSRLSNPLVIRFSGGHNAGHTVYKDSIKHVFSNFGSGTLRGASTYWDKRCTMEPVGLLNEYQDLLNKGLKPIIYINGKCPVTTPYDIEFNRTTEQVNKHGSVGVGLGATYEREEKKYSLLFEDLFFDSVFKIKVQMIEKYYSNIECYAEDIEEFIAAIKQIRKIEDIHLVEYIPLGNCDNLIYEGSQGLLLDMNIGFFPHVTRSNTGTKNINSAVDHVYYITRAYQTRHGNGPMTNEGIPRNIKANEYETNVTHDYQGHFRRTLLDVDLLNYAIFKDGYSNGIKDLVITCLDHIENDLRFTEKGKIVYCDSEQDFLFRIRNSLSGINKVFISKSPYSDNIVEFK